MEQLAACARTWVQSLLTPLQKEENMHIFNSISYYVCFLRQLAMYLYRFCLKICFCFLYEHLCTCMYAHHMHAKYLQRSEETDGSPETGVTGGVSHHVHAENQTWVLHKSSKCS